MINLGLLRDNPEKIRSLIKRKDPSFNVDELISLDTKLRSVRAEVESLRQQRNQLAEQAAKTKITDELRTQSIEIGKAIKQQEKLLDEVLQKFNDQYLRCPNILNDDVPAGDKSANKVVKEVGKKRQFDFEFQHHLEIATKIGWLDFETGARLAGSQFAFYKGEGAKVLYALTMLMLRNNMKYGYQMVLPPYLVNEKSLEVASNFPKFKDQVYAIKDEDLYLLPTAEVPLTNIYRDKIFVDDELPCRLTAWTSCFRREAGGYGATERGLIRIHQFEKCEIYAFCQPDQAQAEHERMMECAENILKMLGLTYRVSLLAAQDCSFPSAKTYDIEVWLPGQECFYEVSSSSNCTDFQARRGSIRFKKSDMRKPELVYTLNTSSLAVPRLMVALIENCQQADGSIKLPEVLTTEINRLFGE